MKVLVKMDGAGLKKGEVYEVAETRTVKVGDRDFGPFERTMDGTILLENGPLDCGRQCWYSWHRFEKI
jgi:hypothetical protein